MTVARAHDVEHCADPLCLIAGARGIFESLRELLVDADDKRGGWSRAFDGDPARRRLVLDQLSYAGEHLARLTLVIDETTAMREQIQELADADLAVLRAAGRT